MKISTKLIKSAFAASFTASMVAGMLSTVPLWTPSAFAQVAETISAKTIVDQAKTDKLVGEKLNGYLGFIAPSVSTEVRDAVNEINIKRKSIYTRLAREQNVGVADVAGLTGEKLVAKAKPGEMIMLGDNQWSTTGS